MTTHNFAEDVTWQYHNATGTSFLEIEPRRIFIKTAVGSYYLPLPYSYIGLHYGLTKYWGEPGAQALDLHRGYWFISENPLSSKIEFSPAPFPSNSGYSGFCLHSGATHRYKDIKDVIKATIAEVLESSFPIRGSYSTMLIQNPIYNALCKKMDIPPVKTIIDYYLNAPVAEIKRFFETWEQLDKFPVDISLKHLKSEIVVSQVEM